MNQVDTFNDFNILSLGTIEGVQMAFRKVVDMDTVNGHYLEFGLYQGYSLLHAYREITKYKIGCHLFGFDSFLGLPEPASDECVYHYDSGAALFFEAGQFACSKRDVYSNLSRFGVDMSRVTLVEGFYEETLVPELHNQLNIQEAAVILVDCDLYDSARSALKFVAPLIREGTIILFDDWNIYGNTAYKGERRAFGEFLEQNPHIKAIESFSFGWHGQSFLFKNDGFR